MARGQGVPLDGTKFRTAREAAGLSQRQVAEKVGTPRQKIVRYEGGKERPEVGRLAALAAAVGATVADLVEEDSLPEGLAGLRVGAGLTLAAAADAVRAHIPAGTGIACSRPVLADAERGVLPPTWAPPPVAGAVRNALGVAYGAGVEEVVAAWSATFGAAAADQAAREAGSINGTPGEGLTETAPPAPEPTRAVGKWKPLSAWLWERLVQVAAAGPGGADDEWSGGARWQEHLATREGARGTTGRGYVDDDTHGRYWLTEAGRAHILAHRGDYAALYSQVRQPRAVREMDADTLLRVEDPDAYTARQVWGSARPASQRWTIRAKVRVLAGGIIDAAAHGVEGYAPSVRWGRDDASGGVRAPRVDEVVEVTEWTSPWRSMPEAAPNLPGARPTTAADAVELPFDDHAQEHEEPPAPGREAGVRLELLTAEQAEVYDLGTARMYRVHQDEHLVGFVWRGDIDPHLWCAAEAAADGSLGAVAVLAPRGERTRRGAVKHLLDPNAAYIRGPAPEAGPAEPVEVVLSRSAVVVDGREYVRYPVRVDGELIGHVHDRREWDLSTGWVFQARLSPEEQVRLSPAEQAAPDALSAQPALADAVPELLTAHYGHPLHIASLVGERADLGIHLHHMERWELRRGRVSGREDVYARSECWGWLQPADGGFTAHTTAGPVPGSLSPTREDAVQALWAHLYAPLPPPRLGERARARRHLRPRATRDRPLCPYTDAELARVRVVRDDPAVEHGLYRAESPADHRVLGYLWRRDAKKWAYAPVDPATGGPPEQAPALSTAPTRAAALEALLAQPGPLWGDPADAIVH
ncbi:helix-turn-helix domain-containing protein [Nocardiopsis tropica]|uniref:Helix-turn-helix transcriptional regulator n=1 Tax=Nocardiopsis tropica TaxID=109330 RepID=A0ABV2A743_9ACTN